MSVRSLSVSSPHSISEKHAAASVLPLCSNPSDIAIIFIISGPAGSGKSTIATHLARELSIPFLEGDDYHSAANKAKMTHGIPLEDADRWSWLLSLRSAAVAQLQHAPAVVVSCSALSRPYRDVFRSASLQHAAVQVQFIHLAAGRQTLEARLAARPGHYMKTEMVGSQLLALEEPGSDEGDVVTIDAQRGVEGVCEDARVLALSAMEAAGS